MPPAPNALALAAFLALAAPAPAQEAASSGGLTAWLDLPSGPPVAGQSFDARLRLLDATTGEAPRGLTLRSWVRPVEAGAPACTEATRAFRATGSLPRGVVDLDAPVLAAAFSEGAITLADPALAQARATLRKAWAFAEPPSALIADPATGSFVMAFPATGEIVRMDASDGALTLVATGFSAPTTLVAFNGTLWVEDATGLHHVAQTTTALGPGTLGPATPLGILTAATGTLTLRSASGTPLITTHGALPAAALPDPATPDQPAGIAHLSGTTLHIAYASGARQSLSLGAPADTLIPAEDGRTLFALDSTAGVIARIDLAKARVTEVIADTGFPIGQALMVDGRLYLLARDSSAVAVLNPTAAADAPRWRRLALGPPHPPGAGLWQLMTAPTPVGPVLALNPLNGLVSEIDAPEALGNAPQMTGFALRGGQPIALATLTRSWRDTGTPGTLATRLALPTGTHEIVVTAGLGLTLCLPLTVTGPSDTAPTATLHLTAPPGDTLHFRLETTGATPPAPTETRITIAAIGTGWRQTTIATPDASGTYTLTVALPGPGLYAATPDLPGLEARATTFQVP